jgi:uncharacterized repeat protein (TIGR01451 family)
MPPGGTVLFTISARVRPDFPGGTITNVATATPGQNTICADHSPTCPADASFETHPDPAHVRILKTVTSGRSAKPGSQVTFDLVVSNIGTGARARGVVADPVPAGLENVSWTTTVTSGSFVRPTSGNGDIQAAVGIPAGGGVTFTITGNVAKPFKGDFEINNVATLHPGENTRCDPHLPGELCNTNAVVRVPTHETAAATTPGKPPHQQPQPPLATTGVPTVSLLAQALLLMMCGSACLLLGRRAK